MLLSISDHPIQRFATSGLSLATFKQLFRFDWPLILPLFVGATLALQRNRIWLQWKDVAHGQSIRLVAVVAAATLAWTYSLQAYDGFSEQWQLSSRIGIALFAIAFIWKPLFSLPFLFFLTPVVARPDLAIGSASWAIPHLPFSVVILLASSWTVFAWRGHHNSSLFFFLLLCLVAAHYLPSGLSKLRSNWIFENETHLLLPNAYAQGWLSGFSKESISQLARLLRPTDPIVNLITAGLECSGFLLLWHRRFTIFAVAGWIAFHAIVLALSGICFWPWMAVEASLLTLILIKRGPLEERFFSVRKAMGSFVMVFVWMRLIDPSSLTWFDARANCFYEFQAISDTGARYRLPPSFFAPYEYQFAMGYFHFLSDEPTLPIAWGAAGRHLASEVNRLGTVEQLLGFETRNGLQHTDEAKAEEFAAFVESYARSAKRHPDLARALQVVQAPRYFWHAGKGTLYRYQAPIRSIEVRQVLTFFDGKTIHRARDKLVRRIAVDPASAAE